MASFIDRMAVLFDFEVDFFSKYGIDTHHVGHPLVDGLQVGKTRDEFFNDFQLNAEEPVLALLPGSRKQEIENLLPDMLETANRLAAKFPQLQVALGLAETIQADWLNAFLENNQNIRVITNATYELMSYASAGIVASGTATLECACFQLPFVLMYRVAPMSYTIGKRVVKIPHIGLVNIVAQQEIVREFVQENIKPEKIALELEKYIFDEDFRSEKKEQLAIVKEKLGQPGAADKTAELVLDVIKTNQYE
jgi:lipid-A-disaccharide synthase